MTYVFVNMISEELFFSYNVFSQLFEAHYVFLVNIDILASSGPGYVKVRWIWGEGQVRVRKVSAEVKVDYSIPNSSKVKSHFKIIWAWHKCNSSLYVIHFNKIIEDDIIDCFFTWTNPSSHGSLTDTFPINLSYLSMMLMQF